MLNEFCSLTGADESRFKENWEEYERLVFKYAPLEQKKSVKNLMSQYLAEECDNAGRCIYMAMHTLSIHALQVNYLCACILHAFIYMLIHSYM